jgi:hypothetical protein
MFFHASGSTLIPASAPRSKVIYTIGENSGRMAAEVINIVFPVRDSEMKAARRYF